jgi:hypothetical protein
MPSTFARIGRSYPRLQPEPEVPGRAPRTRPALRFTIAAGGVIVLVSTVGWIGWMLAR